MSETNEVREMNESFNKLRLYCIDNFLPTPSYRMYQNDFQLWGCVVKVDELECKCPVFQTSQDEALTLASNTMIRFLWDTRFNPEEQKYTSLEEVHNETTEEQSEIKEPESTPSEMRRVIRERIDIPTFNTRRFEIEETSEETEEEPEMDEEDNEDVFPFDLTNTDFMNRLEEIVHDKRVDISFDPEYETEDTNVIVYVLYNYTNIEIEIEDNTTKIYVPCIPERKRVISMMLLTLCMELRARCVCICDSSIPDVYHIELT